MKADSFIASERKINAFQKIHAEFKDILQKEKCRSCSCFYTDVLNIVLGKIKTFRKGDADRRIAKIENDFERWAKDADLLKMHG